MKPAKFDYLRPRDLAEAVRALAAGGEDARLLAGGQSLGPMLNLRVVAPSLLVDLSRLAELGEISERGDSAVLGAGVTHAQIEDGALSNATVGLAQRVASGIAYRPVRNRGTVGGSLAHADPCGDWAPVMMALGAELDIRGAHGTRRLAASQLIAAPLMTTLARDEAIVSIQVPMLGGKARWGHVKFCRKPGDFAESLAVVVIDAARDAARVVLASRTGVPAHLFATEQCLRSRGKAGGDAWSAIAAAIEQDVEEHALRGHWSGYDRSLHRATLTRAVKEALI
ncbi:MAG TPA: FAD binding domain-containing protein [Stellaceae bacterium]|nr:FAD binding domain-containing protein [Stellaceae bacterium]